MAMQLGPQPLRSVIRDHVEDQRDLFCTRYDACLGRAAHEDWTSWTCTHCARFQRPRRKATRTPACPTATRRPTEATAVTRWSRPEARTIARPAPARHADPRPGLPSGPALFVAAARAVADGVPGRALDAACEWEEEVFIAARDPEGLLGRWIDELMRRSLESGVRFEEVDVVHLSERRLVAFIRGVRLERTSDPAEAQPALAVSPE